MNFALGIGVRRRRASVDYQHPCPSASNQPLRFDTYQPLPPAQPSHYQLPCCKLPPVFFPDDKLYLACTAPDTSNEAQGVQDAAVHTGSCACPAYTISGALNLCCSQSLLLTDVPLHLLPSQVSASRKLLHDTFVRVSAQRPPRLCEALLRLGPRWLCSPSPPSSVGRSRPMRAAVRSRP